MRFSGETAAAIAVRLAGRNSSETTAQRTVAAATQAHRQDDLYLALMIMSAFIMGIVCTFLIYSVWKFRARPGDEDRDGPPLHGNTMLEIVWTVVPALILVVLTFLSVPTWAKIKMSQPPTDFVVQVTAKQFNWQVAYRAETIAAWMERRRGLSCQAIQQVSAFRRSARS